MRKNNICSVEEAMLAMAKEHKLTYDPNGSNKNLLVNTEDSLVNFHISNDKKIDADILYQAAVGPEDAKDSKIQASKKISLNKAFKIETAYAQSGEIPLEALKLTDGASLAVKGVKKCTRKQIKSTFNHMELNES